MDCTEYNMYSLKVQWDTTLENWHPCTERQTIYNIHSINSSNDIMYLLEYLLLSLGLTRSSSILISQKKTYKSDTQTYNKHKYLHIWKWTHLHACIIMIHIYRYTNINYDTHPYNHIHIHMQRIIYSYKPLQMTNLRI